MVSIPNPNVFTEETNQFRSLFPSHTIVRSSTKDNEQHWFLEPVCAPVCPNCGKSTDRIHDSNERIIRDMDFGGRKLFLHTKLRRVRCSCGCRRQEKVDWLSRRLRITNRMVAHVQSLLASGMTVSAVSKQLEMDWDLIKKLDLWRLELEFGHQKIEPFEQLALDEFSLQKRHRYATVACDLKQRKVLWVGKGKSIKQVKPFFEELSSSGANRSIQAVAIDMSNAFARLSDEYLNADVVYDLFHVLKHFREDVLSVARKQIFASLPKKDPQRQFIRGADWVIISPYHLLSPNRQEQLQQIRQMNGLLTDLLPIADQLRSVWRASDIQAASTHLYSTIRLLCEISHQHQFEPARTFANLLRRHENGILYAHRHRVNTSILEGINNTIKVIKRLAYGYRDFNYFALKIKASFPGKNYKTKLRKGFAAIRGQWVACRFKQMGFLRWSLEKLPDDLLAA